MSKTILDEFLGWMDNSDFERLCDYISDVRKEEKKRTRQADIEVMCPAYCGNGHVPLKNGLDWYHILQTSDGQHSVHCSSGPIWDLMMEREK